MSVTHKQIPDRPIASDRRVGASPIDAPTRQPAAWSRVFLLGMASALALWAAFPPLGWWPLAWIAPVGWCLLVAMERLDAARPYRLLYGIGLLHCLLVIHWIRLPHWSAYFGWLALSGYLAVYTPLFIGLRGSWCIAGDGRC